MGLSSDLLSQFAKATANTKKTDTDTTVYGTVVERDGKKYVRLDGSDRITPMSSAVSAEAGERVSILIKNHSASVTGNLSSPAARVGSVEEIDGKTHVYIDSIEGKVLVYDQGKFDRLESIDADFVNLKAENAIFYNTVTENLEAKQGKIDELESKMITTDNLDAKYVNIDFANIDEAAFKEILAAKGLIKDLTVGDTTITGELIGVTISGDLIKANTLMADRLIVKGENGLYYTLNVTEGGIVADEEVTEEDLQNGLHGKNIIAKTITAEKIKVDDLTAFGAKLANFTIVFNENGVGTLYSGVKESVDNGTEGVYLDSDGQMNVGGASQYIKYYVDEDGARKLDIKADSIRLGSTGKTVDESLDNAESRLETAEQALVDLNEVIRMLVTDENGTSLMVQTENGWTYCTQELQSAVDDANEAIAALTEKTESFNASIAALQQATTDHGNTLEYVTVTSYEDEPCVALGESDSDFKLLITNTRIMFLNGSTLLTYINNKGLVTDNIEVKEELRQGNFVWAVRANGNYGLTWKEVTD